MFFYQYYLEICLAIIRIQEADSQFYIIQFSGSHRGVLQTTFGRIWKSIPSQEIRERSRCMPFTGCCRFTVKCNRSQKIRTFLYPLNSTKQRTFVIADFCFSISYGSLKPQFKFLQCKGVYQSSFGFLVICFLNS